MKVLRISWRMCCFWVLLFAAQVMAQPNSYVLSQWHLQCPDPKNPTGFDVSVAATVPGCIHTDLLHHHLIPDPFYGTNEDSLQWLGETACTYRTYFWKQDLAKLPQAELVFDGVTGYAEVFLNGEPLCHSDGNNVMDNAFRIWHFPLTGKVKTYNALEVRFTPAPEIIRLRAAQLPYSLPDSRALLRTPPYQAGWDWGPKLVTCGMTGNVYIDQWQHARLQDLCVQQQKITSEKANLLVSVDIESLGKQTVTLTCYVEGQSAFERACNLTAGRQTISFACEIPKPVQWNCAGQGEQKLYTIGVTLQKGKKELDSRQKRIGLRIIELRQQKDTIGRSFEFVVNGQPVFMKGCNWIPADFFPHRLNTAHYRELLQACKDANMNMIRVWGGGIYEPDVFYDICDELGILVWQDFMYACALYPGDSSFLANAATEATDQLRRLRHHPCIAVWCGNNEVKNGWDDWGWKADFTASQQTKISQNMENLFVKTLGNAVQTHAAGTPYVATSPLWGWGHPECCTEGDSHYWGVWWGEQPFEIWYQKTGRFMSEFGFQSYPDLATIATFTAPSEQHLASATLQNHQKHARGIAIINKAMNQYFYQPDDLANYVYVSQLVQAFGTGMALEEHRRRAPYCMGTLFWQLNDCWPVASWSCIDYYGRRKALYYEAKRQFAPIIIATDTLNDNQLPVYIVNDTPGSVVGGLRTQLCRLDGTVLETQQLDNMCVPSGSSTHVMTAAFPKERLTAESKQLFWRADFYDSNQQLLAQKIKLLAYPGDMAWQPAPISLTILENNIVELQSTHLQYGVELTASVEGHFSDNFFTLLPNEPLRVSFIPQISTAQPIEFSVRSFVKH